MARMPGAAWRPMPGSSTTRMSAYDVLCVHTMVGSLAGTDSWFRKLQDGTNSHFGVGGDGTIYQWVDTAYRSGASYNGNYHLISVECADTGAPFPSWTGSDVPAFTGAQLDALGRIARWVHDTHGIPLVQIPDAKPFRRGVGYHRLGVPGYMVAGAEQWSTKPGKVCPGDRRIAQIPQVISNALGADDMFSDDDRKLLQEVRDRLRGGDPNLDMPQRILMSSDQVLSRLVGNHTDGTDRLTDLWTAILAVQDPQQTSDPVAVAGALAGLLPADLAKQVADELAKRLNA